MEFAGGSFLVENLAGRNWCQQRLAADRCMRLRSFPLPVLHFNVSLVLEIHLGWFPEAPWTGYDRLGRNAFVIITPFVCFAVHIGIAFYFTKNNTSIQTPLII